MENVIDQTIAQGVSKVLNGTDDIFEDDPDEHRLFKNFNDKKWLNRNLDDGKVSSCKRILYETVDDHTRVWDVLILIPNLIFVLFLLFRIRHARRRLAATNAPVLAAFHNLTLISSMVGVTRCLLSIIHCNVNGFNEPSGEIIDKILWITLRAFLLATEISVLAFALLSGHLDSKSSIRRVVLVASTVSIVFSSLQVTLEFARPDPAFYVSDLNHTLFGHGGRVFWAVSSALFALVYSSVLLLPLLPCRHWLMLPQKRSFYYYVTFLLILNVVQAIGCAMTEVESDAVSNPGLCFVNMTTYIYFVAYTPIVYFTFLSSFFGSQFAQPAMLFSYKAQTDDMDDDVGQSHFTLQATPNGHDDDDDIFAQEQNNPIIINGTLGLANGQA